jgi:cyclopropane fatty-acyl-phospholipid synthase-like methyltransferase
MSDIDYFTIVERHHTFQNPTSEQKLDRLIEYCGVADGHRVLDIGCGKGWLLHRMAARWAIEGVGVEVRQSFLAEAKKRIEGEPTKGRLVFHHSPAKDFHAPLASFDVALCIGASFAIGSFEMLIEWLAPFVKRGGVLAVGDIYARETPLPDECAVHFSGGAPRSLADTAARLNDGGLSLIGLIDSSLDDWDRYESLHWKAADEWLLANPTHPERERFIARHERAKLQHIRFDRRALGWALFVSRVR